MNEHEFWERVERGETCWVWTGSRTTAGYGNLRWQGGYEYAHRVALQLSDRQLDDGLVVDHLCRNRACVNPNHLEVVEQLVNVRRGMSGYGLRTECKRGHDVTDATNVRVDSAGGQQCRKCDVIREAQRPSRARRAA